MSSAPFTACKRFDDSKAVFPGWLCCKCRVYNGYQRLRCKACRHPSCFEVTNPDELFPIMRTLPGNSTMPDVISQRERLERGAEEPPQ